MFEVSKKYKIKISLLSNTKRDISIYLQILFVKTYLCRNLLQALVRLTSGVIEFNLSISSAVFILFVLVLVLEKVRTVNPTNVENKNEDVGGDERVRVREVSPFISSHFQQFYLSTLFGRFKPKKLAICFTSTSTSSIFPALGMPQCCQDIVKYVINKGINDDV